MHLALPSITVYVYRKARERASAANEKISAIVGILKVFLGWFSYASEGRLKTLAAGLVLLLFLFKMSFFGNRVVIITNGLKHLC